MNFVKMIYTSLSRQDHFGFKVLKNGYDPAYSTIDTKKSLFADVQSDKLTQPVKNYLQDILVFE